MCLHCRLYSVVALHDTRLPKGQARTIMARVLLNGKHYMERETSHLMLFPIIGGLEDMDRICRLRYHAPASYCVILIKLKEGGGDSFVDIPAGKVLAMGQKKRLPPDDEEEEEETSFKVKLAKPLEISKDVSIADAYVVPFEPKRISHRPAQLILKSELTSQLEIVSKGVPYFQSGKMTRVQVRLKKAWKKTTSFKVDVGAIVGSGFNLDSENNLKMFLKDDKRKQLFSPEPLSWEVKRFKLSLSREACLSSAELARGLVASSDPLIPVWLHADQDSFSLEQPDGSDRQYQVKVTHPIRKNPGFVFTILQHPNYPHL